MSLSPRKMLSYVMQTTPSVLVPVNSYEMKQGARKKRFYARYELSATTLSTSREHKITGFQ